MLTALKIKVEIGWYRLKQSFWIRPKIKVGRFFKERSKLTRREMLVLCLFVFLIGIGIGQWWRVAQVEPRKDAVMMEMIEEMKRQRRVIAQDFINFEIRLMVLEKKNNLWRRGGAPDDRNIERAF